MLARVNRFTSVADAVERLSENLRINSHGNLNAAMITNLLIGSALVAITVIIHAMGLGMVLSHVLQSSARPDTRFWPIAWLLIRIAWFLIVIHFIEIAVWALFFWWHKCLPDAELSFYFSGVTTLPSVTGTWGCQKNGD